MQNKRIATETWLHLFALDLLIVCVVLLVVCMAITPLNADFPLRLDLPESRTALRSPGFERELTVTVRRDAIFLGHAVTDLAQLNRSLMSTHVDRDSLRMQIARDVPFGTARRIVQAAQQAGFRTVTFVVRRAPQVGPESNDFRVFDCPPDYDRARNAAIFALVAFAGVFVVSRRTHRLGCIGWLLLVTAAVSVCVGWEAMHPSCGLWY
jgi:biopolymer transport protein ExbD